MNHHTKCLLFLPVILLTLSSCNGSGSNEVRVDVIEKIATNDDFITGVDLSSIIEVEEAGGKFYDFDGTETDIFTLLYDNGVNYIRIRLWNNPFNSNDESFGGGGNDITKDIEIAQRAVGAEMKVCLDFHYSDFWADPGKQICPYEWKGLSGDNLYAEATEWTTDVLEQFDEAGCLPSMVQIGNEINNHYICGLTSESAYNSFLKECCGAVREYDSNIQIAIHLAGDQSASTLISSYQSITNAGVDFDIIGLSYYPYWHGTIKNFTKTLESINESFNKKICIMEYAYGWTTDYDDNYPNMANIFDKSCARSGGYSASPAGQADAIHDINEMIVDIPQGTGSFYWEPAWLARNDTSWAAQASYSYQAENGLSTDGLGTCSWANQALFDYDGHALESLKTFNLMRGK